MPAAEQKIAVGLPKPPAPIIKTLLFKSIDCPSSSISGIIN